MFWNLLKGLGALFVLQHMVLAEEDIFIQIWHQRPTDNHWYPVRRPYSQNRTDLHISILENQGIIFQLHFPFSKESALRTNVENVPEIENSFNKMCCRFEDRFLKDIPMLSPMPKLNRMFLLDLSPQMSPEEWSHIQQSLMLMVDNMCLGRKASFQETDREADGQTVTLMTMDGQVRHYHRENLEVEKIKRDIVHMNGQQWISCTTTLLKIAYDFIDQYSDSTKSSTEHEVLLITDGQSNCHLPFSTEARHLRSVAHVSVVSITKNKGPQANIRVTDIASDSSIDNVYSFHSCGAFLNMMKHIDGSPCRRCQTSQPY